MSMLPCLVSLINRFYLLHLILTFTALMCWFVTLASKMTGTEIPGVGMAPGGKIVKPEQEVHQLAVTFYFQLISAGEGAP